MASILMMILLEGVQLPQRLSSFLNFNSLNGRPVDCDHFRTLGLIFSIALARRKASKAARKAA